MIEDMRMRKLSPGTRTGYIRSVRNFARYLGRSPDTATIEDLRNDQLHLPGKGTGTTIEFTLARAVAGTPQTQPCRRDTSVISSN